MPLWGSAIDFESLLFACKSQHGGLQQRCRCEFRQNVQEWGRRTRSAKSVCGEVQPQIGVCFYFWFSHNETTGPLCIFEVETLEYPCLVSKISAQKIQKLCLREVSQLVYQCWTQTAFCGGVNPGPDCSSKQTKSRCLSIVS